MEYLWIPDILHNNTNSSLLGTSPAQKQSSVFKKRGKPLNGWSEADKNMPIEYYNWCSSWAQEWLRVLKPELVVLFLQVEDFHIDVFVLWRMQDLFLKI